MLNRLGWFTDYKQAFIPEAHYGPKFRKNPTLLVYHYTAGSSAQSALNEFRTKKLSAHFIAPREGGIIQCVPVTHRAYHAGKSEYNGMKSVNNFSLGLEIVNPGKLEFKRKNWYTWYNQKVDPEMVYIDTEGTPWHRYTEAQFIACHELAANLAVNMGIEKHASHSDISSGRKIDPGNAWHKGYLEWLLNNKL